MEEQAGKGAQRFLVSSSPHVHSGESISRIMVSVVGALVPACIWSVILFGWPAAQTLLLSVAACLGFEWLFVRLAKKPSTIADGSALVTGVLLAMNLPPDVPFWLPIVGGLVAVGLAKQVFGGLGYNIFNPALVARAFLLISFPVQMTHWTQARNLLARGVEGAVHAVDAVSAATPLGMMKEELRATGYLGDSQHLDAVGTFLGNMPGSAGEMSAFLLLVGAAYLLYKGYITWHTPFSFVGTVAVFTGILWLINPDVYASPLFHVLTGGLILGAFFMATDMVTGPLTPWGRIVFGVGCGVITVVIRLWGGYPEGVSFAILIMNAFTPLIDRWVKVRKFGLVKAQEA